MLREPSSLLEDCSRWLFFNYKTKKNHNVSFLFGLIKEKKKKKAKLEPTVHVLPWGQIYNDFTFKLVGVVCLRWLGFGNVSGLYLGVFAVQCGVVLGHF